NVVAIHVDADLLPREGSQVLFIGNRALLGGSAEARLVFESERWVELAPHCAAPRHGHGTLEVAPGQLETYQQLDDPYGFLAVGRPWALNLAQGEFAVRSGTNGLAQWKPVAAVLVFDLLMHLVLQLIQECSLVGLSERYAVCMRALYTVLFAADLDLVTRCVHFAEYIVQRGSDWGRFK